MGYLSEYELNKMGFLSFGSNVKISDKASFYGVENISMGNNVRIDDFCVISSGKGGIKIGSNVHIAVFSSLIGSELIQLEDFCNISSRVSIYSSTDDFSGEYMTSPVIPQEFTGVVSLKVLLGRHVVIGSGSIVLPGVKLREGVAIGALSLVNKSFDEWIIAAGIPALEIKKRKKNLLIYEKKMKRLSYEK